MEDERIKKEKKRKKEHNDSDGPPGKKRKLNENITPNPSKPQIPPSIPQVKLEHFRNERKQIPPPQEHPKISKSKTDPKTTAPKPKPVRSPLEVMVFQGPKIPKKKIAEVKHKYPTKRRRRKRRLKRNRRGGSINQNVQIDKPRKRSDRIRTVKMFINWVSFCLIKKYVNSGNDVLSFDCEKGDHLHKYHSVGVRSWTGVDSDPKNLHEVVKRYNKRLEWNFEPTLICFELGKKDFMSSITELKTIRKKFDVVCCFTHLQRYFEDETMLSTFMKNVTTPLKKGGKFICIIKDGYVVKKKLDSSETTKFCTDLYEFEFEKKIFSKRDGPFGIHYTFYFKLEDEMMIPPPPPPSSSSSSSTATESSVNDQKKDLMIAPPNEERINPVNQQQQERNKIRLQQPKKRENLIHPAYLKSVTRNYGMDIVEEVNFHEFIVRYKEEYKELFSSFLRTNSVQPPDWDAMYLYRVFVFEKRGIEIEDKFFKDKRSRYQTHHHFIAENEVLDLRQKEEME